MHLSTLTPVVALTLFFLSAVSGSPVINGGRSIQMASRNGGARPSKAQTTPTVPLAGATTSLPSPDATLTLAYIALGRGVQNYTCASSLATDIPVSIGAIATLYDITSLGLAGSPELNYLPETAVYEPLPTGNFITTECGTFPLLGNHYFNATATPTFNLTSVRSVLWGKKTADITAPYNSTAGPTGTGSVDWLQLQDKGGSYGVTEVYRVDTAGGNPPATCAGQSAVLEVPYSAEYWFYK